MIRILFALIIATASCFAQVNQAHLKGTTANVQTQINNRLRIDLSTNLLSGDVVIDGSLTNDFDFDDIARLTLDATDASLTGVSTAYLDGGITTVRGVTNLQVITPAVFAGTATSGQVLKLTDAVEGTVEFQDATISGAATNLSASGTLTPSSGAWRTFGTDADQLYTIGDSFTYSAGATSYTNGYVSKLAASLGMSAVNIANGSFSIADANWSCFPGWSVTNSGYSFNSPASITEDQNWTVLIGFNDTRTGTTTASRYRLGLDHLIRYLTIPDSVKRWAVSPSASTGTWTPSTWTAYTNKAATSSSGTLTFSNVIGSEVYIGFLSWATNYGGTISVTVDGTSIDSRSVASAAYGNREYINGSDASIPDHVGPYGNGKIDFCPHVISATSLGLGAHTVVVTAASGPVTVIWVAGNSWKRTLREGPNLFLGTIPRQSPWTSGGTDALQASFNVQLRSAINSARAAGLRVAWAPVGEYYDPTTEQSVDGVHPGNTGHTTIASAFEQAISGEMPQMADVGYQAVSDPNGSFATVAVSGASTLTGNAALGGALSVAGSTTLTGAVSAATNLTVTGRFLNLPTGVPGGLNSRFGFGSITNSSISLQHSDTTINQTLNLTGAGISSVQTSSLAATNLTLGLAGTTTAIAGTATVAGDVTATGRLLAIPTIGSGFTSRFGADSVAASAVEVQHSSTNLDRRLVLGGNTIASAVNSTGAGANLAIGTTGFNVGVLGTASVAGATTLGSAGTAITRVRHGTATLVGGTVTVADANVTTSSRILLTSNTDGGTPGWLRVSARVASTSFTVTSSSGTDTSTVAWMMIEP